MQKEIIREAQPEDWWTEKKCPLSMNPCLGSRCAWWVEVRVDFEVKKTGACTA